MKKKEHHILQYEFFHVGGDNVTDLAELMRECAKRAGENLPLAMAGENIGSGIKTAIRVYDFDDGRMVRLVRAYEKADEAWWKGIGELRLGLLSRLFDIWRLHWFAYKKKRHQTKLRNYAIWYLQHSKQMNFPVAVEKADRSFRPMKDGERHELLESVKSTESFWLFAFKPNEILADENESAGAVM